jgi:hypothetical protein
LLTEHVTGSPLAGGFCTLLQSDPQAARELAHLVGVEVVASGPPNFRLSAIVFEHQARS